MGRTHNLVALSEQLVQAGQATPEVGDLLSLLNPYAVTLRYDDIEVELMSPTALFGVVEVMIVWADKSVATIADDAARNI